MWEHRRALPLASLKDPGVEFEALVSSDRTPLVWEEKAKYLGLKKGLLSRPHLYSPSELRGGGNNSGDD